jgi:anaerobic selenocysteine-containing dehydrogenase
MAAGGRWRPARYNCHVSSASARQVRRSVCALDCPDACALLVTVEDGRAVKLRGDPAHPVTRGFLCEKVARYLEREYAPDRLLYPQIRTGVKGEGRFARISWDAALDLIAERLKEISEYYGPEAILPYSYAGTMGLVNGAGMDRRFFHRLGASRLDRTICSSAGGAALTASLGFRYGADPEQFRHARLILAWGANILGTNVHLWPFIVEARRQGARFYAIDPASNRTTQLADRHYRIHPGTDQALALAMMHVILAEGLHDADYLERYCQGVEHLKAAVGDFPPGRAEALTGIPAADIASLAREYAATQPAVIRMNYGIQRHERGGAAAYTISLLPALVGAWRHPGGGLLLSTSHAFHLNRNALERPDLQKLSPLGREARLVNMSELGKALTALEDPPIKALIVYNSNPAAVAPNQSLVLEGLRRPDLFTVVLEQFQTDTADYADLLLPVTTFLEHPDLYFSWGHYYLQLARPALEAPGEARSNFEIFRSLAERMGFAEPCFQESEDDLMRAALASDHPFLAGITLERLEQERSIKLRFAEDGRPFLPFVQGGFGTPSGKCEIRPELLKFQPPRESRHGDQALASRYPLELISPKADAGLNSTFSSRPEVDEETGTLWMHPEDARARGVAGGDPVRVFNDRGSCRLRAAVSGDLAPGVVVARAVRWNRNSPDRRNVNWLTSDRLTDLGGGPAFYSCLVEVQRCEDSSH